MTDTVYLLQDNGDLHPMEMTPYEKEDVLQELLERYPDLLVGAEVNTEFPRRWLLVKREQSIPDEAGNRWSVDHLFIDQDGVPTLVEVKRSSDTRIRREVVGQMLDYAANAVIYWPVTDIRREFETRCLSANLDPEEEWRGKLETEIAYDAFWERVSTNLKAGHIRLIFLADAIPRKLRRIIEFLNEQMSPADVLAVEVKQYVGSGIKTLVPRLIGQTSASEAKKGQSNPQWNEQSFFSDLESRQSTSAVNAARRIYEWSKQHFEIWWGRGKRDGSFIPDKIVDGTHQNPFAVYSSGQVYPYFEHMKKKPQFEDEEVRIALLDKLNKIPGVILPSDGINRRPPILLNVLGKSNAVELFIQVFEEEYLTRLTNKS